MPRPAHLRAAGLPYGILLGAEAEEAAAEEESWTPQDEASLVFDIDMDTFVGIEGAEVGTLPDVEGAVTFNKFTGGGELRLNRAEANGHDAVQLVSTNDDFYASATADLSALFPTAATLVVVAEPNTDTEYCLYEHQGRDVWWRYSDGNTYHGTFRTARVVTAQVHPSSGVHYWVVRSSASGFNVRLDGASVVTAAASYEGGTRHRVGFQSTGLQGFNGWIYRIMAFSSHLADAAVTTDLEPYIQTLYDL